MFGFRTNFLEILKKHLKLERAKIRTTIHSDIGIIQTFGFWNFTVCIKHQIASNPSFAIFTARLKSIGKRPTNVQIHLAPVPEVGNRG